MIEVKNISFSYDGTNNVLEGISLKIERGRYVAIMGENGAGKSTLIRHFNGLLKPTEGEVLVDSLNTKKTSTSSLSKKVAIVFQYPESMFFSESVRDEIKSLSSHWALELLRRYLVNIGTKKDQDICCN